MRKHSTANPDLKYWIGDELTAPVIFGWSLEYDDPDAMLDELVNHPDGNPSTDTSYAATVTDDLLSIERTDAHRWDEPGYISVEYWREPVAASPLNGRPAIEVAIRAGFTLKTPGRVRNDVVTFEAEPATEAA